MDAAKTIVFRIYPLETRPAGSDARKHKRTPKGKRIVDGLSERLRAEFGKGYDRSNLFHMRAFFLAYPKVDAVRRQLSWTHYRLLLRVDNYYQRELTAPDENPLIGIALCADKSEAVVRYALPEGNTQIFASRYKLHLPTDEELGSHNHRNRNVR